MEKIVRTTCQSSHMECGCSPMSKMAKIIRIEGDPQHPMTKGFICVRDWLPPKSYTIPTE